MLRMVGRPLSVAGPTCTLYNEKSRHVKKSHIMNLEKLCCHTTSAWYCHTCANTECYSCKGPKDKLSQTSDHFGAYVWGKYFDEEKKFREEKGNRHSGALHCIGKRMKIHMAYIRAGSNTFRCTTFYFWTLHGWYFLPRKTYFLQRMIISWKENFDYTLFNPVKFNLRKG